LNDSSPFNSPPPDTPGPTPIATGIVSPVKPMPRIIALMNQKGGVGKTTTTVNLGAALAERGSRVLFIDLDPQAHLTLHLGVDPESLERSVYDVLTDPAITAVEVAREVGERMLLLPAEVNLAGVEGELSPLAAEGKAQGVLREKCVPLLARGFDYVMIDCPPSLGLLTINGLSLATEVFVPMQAHYLALQGLSKLLQTVGLVQQGVNPALRVTGIVLCMHEAQTLLAAEVLNDLSSFLEAARGMDVPWCDAQVLQPPIRRNIKLAECPSFGQTIFAYASQCPGAHDYRQLAASVEIMGT